MSDVPNIVDGVARTAHNAFMADDYDDLSESGIERAAWRQVGTAIILYLYNSLSEPTAEMKRAGANHLPVTPGGATDECAGRVFEAMIAQALMGREQ